MTSYSRGATGEDWTVAAVILAVIEHRRKIARMLSRLDELQRHVVETGVAALEDGTVDVATLLVRLSERLREGDGQLQMLVDELKVRRRTPRTVYRGLAAPC
jgi:hypothetical protein